MAAHTAAADAAYAAFAHDLNFRTASFVPNLRFRPKSLAGALADRAETVNRWNNLPFDGVVGEVKTRVASELDRQFGGQDGYDAWRSEFLAVFEHVEYVVNIRLLFALCQVDGRSLHRLMSDLMGRQLEGTTLEVRDPAIADPPGRRSYHVAQSDGWFVGDGAIVGLEIKTNGKAKGTRFDAAQLAKHAWMAANLLPDGTHGRSTNLLVLVPEQGGRLQCLGSDISEPDASRRLAIAERQNSPFDRFLTSVGSLRAQYDVAYGKMDARVRSYAELVQAAKRVLGQAPDGATIVHDLEVVANTATRSL